MDDDFLTQHSRFTWRFREGGREWTNELVISDRDLAHDPGVIFDEIGQQVARQLRQLHAQGRDSITYEQYQGERRRQERAAELEEYRVRFGNHILGDWLPETPRPAPQTTHSDWSQA